MERLNIDSIGPLPAEENGNTYIIVIVDCFTRWVEIYATKDATKFAAKALTEHVGRYGQPSQILSDNGTQYANAVIKELLKLLEKAKQLLIETDKKHMEQITNDKIPTEIESLVLTTYPDSGMGRCPPNKLIPFRKRPFEVIAKKRSSFTLRSLVTNETHDELIFNISK
jgi:hypothetical protein